MKIFRFIISGKSRNSGEEIFYLFHVNMRFYETHDAGLGTL